jgi:hypothetical protein
MADFSLGLPATAVAQNGDAVVVYCAGPATDQTDVKWIRIRAAANRLSHASSGQTGKLGHQFNPHG